MNPRLAATLIIVSALLTLLQPSFATASATENGTCIITDATGAGDCVNNTFSMVNGPITPRTMTPAACTAIGPNAKYDPTESVAALINANTCTLGCICAPQGSTAPNATVANGNKNLPGYVDLPLGKTCNEVCALTPQQPTKQCGEKTLTSSDVNTCACGTTTIDSSSVGLFCCWDGTIKTNQNACAAKPTSTCAPGTAITQACLCGAEAKTSGYCCQTNTWAATQALCPLPPAPVAVCGNNVRDIGEACDSRYDNINGQWVNRTGPGCGNSAQYCTNTCACASAPVTITPPPPPANECIDNPLPTIREAIFDETTQQVNITWDTPLGCEVDNYRVLRSLNTKNNPDTDSGLLANTTKGYANPIEQGNAIAAYYTVYNLYRNGVTTNTTVQVEIPSTDCPVSGITYCYNASRVIQCEGFKATTQDCVRPDICGLNPDNIPSCITPSNECSKCNGLLSMFPNDNTIINDGNGGRDTCEAVNTCFRDLRDTSVELYRSCSEINSCFGYKTQAACEQNKCGKPGDCTWNTLPNAPWMGVCGVENPLYQRCGDCNDLGDSCTKDICEAISTSCYYYEQRDNQPEDSTKILSGCYEETEVTCEMYATKDECEGTARFKLDVTYSNGVRTGVTNNELSRSNDVLRHGKCNWDTAKDVCVKDADNNSVRDLNQIVVPQGKTMHQMLLDFINPVSTIIGVPNKVYPRQFALPIVNDSKVYATVVRENQPCYPLSSTAVAGQYIARAFGVDDDGRWTACIYGEDPSKNLEPLEIFPFIIDTRGPRIDTSVSKQPFYAYTGGVRTVATVAVTVSEPGVCDTKLEFTAGGAVQQADGGLSGSSKTTEYAQQFNITYPQLASNSYVFTVNCTDSNGNTATKTQLFTTDTDFNITNPQPLSREPVNTTQIPISIETSRNATCFYGTPDKLFSQMTRYTNTGGRQHTATMSVRGSGDFTVNTICNFTDALIEADNADKIYFTVDVQAPQTQLCNADTTSATAESCSDTLFTNTRTQEQRILLRCVDGPADSSNFGCDNEKIQYCTTDPGKTCIVRANTDGNTTIVLTGTQPVVLMYQSIDRGGNKEQVQTRTINLTDTTPPVVTIDFVP